MYWLLTDLCRFWSFFIIVGVISCTKCLHVWFMSKTPQHQNKLYQNLSPSKIDILFWKVSINSVCSKSLVSVIPSEENKQNIYFALANTQTERAYCAVEENSSILNWILIYEHTNMFWVEYHKVIEWEVFSKLVVCLKKQ